ncbi:MAG: TonB family protein [Shimia sp.]|nr:TonB family protein [Shimia sp.]
MRQLIETGVFLGLAIAIHLAFAWKGSEAGGDKGGAAGTEYVSLAGAPPQIETVLEEWTRPPDIQATIVEQPDLPEIAEIDAPAAPPLEADVSPRAAVQIAALAPSERPKAPDMQAVQTPLTPPPELEPVVSEMAPPTPVKPVDVPKPDTQQPVVRSTQAPPPPQPLPDMALPTPEPPPPAPEKPKADPKPKPKPKKKAVKAETAQKASPGALEQKAAGSSGGQQAGSNGKTKAVGTGQVKKHVAVWQSKIQSRIERNKRAPRGTKAKGKVRLKIRVAPSGQILAVSVARSSGHAALDQAAVQAVKRSKRFAKAHKSLSKGSYGFAFNVVFR